MGAAALDNLVKIGQLKPEPSSEAEIGGMLEMARSHLADAQVKGVSLNGRFTGAYEASHAAALAALRWHGYRSENRFTVFQHPADLRLAGRFRLELAYLDEIIESGCAQALLRSTESLAAPIRGSGTNPFARGGACTPPAYTTWD